MLRSEKLEYTLYLSENIWTKTLTSLAKWHHKGSHQGIVVLYVELCGNFSALPSTLAAIAAALECKIYSRLLHPPAVNIEIPNAWSWDDYENDCEYYVNHSRAAGIWSLQWNGEDVEETARVLSEEEGTRIWDKATEVATRHE